MGIAIAIFVIPAFLFITSLSVLLVVRFADAKSDKLIVWKSMLLNVVGILIAITITLFATWMVPADQSYGWGQLITRIGVVILGPFVIGVTLLSLQLIIRIASHVLTSVAAGALLASVPTPFIVPFAIWAYEDNQSRTAYERICKDAFMETIEPVSRAKSVAFLPDSFVTPPENSQSQIGEWSAFILNQSLLEYVERPATEESGLKGKAPFERVSTAGNRILSGAIPSEHTKFIYKPLDTISAEYIIRPESLEVESSKEVSLGGAKIEIYRREDNKLIARSQYYWSNSLFRSCPEETRGGLFVYHFIVEALNVKNPEGPKRVLRQ